MKLLMFGPPGSGKGTISKVLAQKANIPHISTGALMRKHLAAHDKLGEELEHAQSKDALAPDELTFRIVQEGIEKNNTTNGYLLDGFPRNVEQAKYVIDHFNITGAVFVDISDELVMERLLARGREDDTKEIIEKRIKGYHKVTKPVLDFLKENNVPIHHQNGNYDIKEIDQVVDNIITWQNSF